MMGLYQIPKSSRGTRYCPASVNLLMTVNPRLTKLYCAFTEAYKLPG